MGDDDGRSTPYQSVQGFHDGLLGDGVQTGRRFVKNQDRCVADDGAGNRNAPVEEADMGPRSWERIRVVAVAAGAAVGKGPLPWRLDGSQMADDSCESSEEDLAPLSRILSA